MTQYDITVAADETIQEYRATLRGPGIEDGREYVFRNPERCASFVEAVNFAYRQGLRDGRRRVENEKGAHYIITGTTPENMQVRRESWLSRMKRRLFY